MRKTTLLFAWLTAVCLIADAAAHATGALSHVHDEAGMLSSAKQLSNYDAATRGFVATTSNLC